MTAHSKDARITAINEEAEQESQALINRLTAEFNEGLQLIEQRRREKIKAMGATALQSEKITEPSATEEEEPQHEKKRPGIAAKLGAITVAGMIMGSIKLSEWRQRRKDRKLREEDREENNTVVAEPTILGSETTQPSDERPGVVANSATVADTPRRKSAWYQRRREVDDTPGAVVEERSSGNGKVIAALLGGLALGVGGTLAYINWKYGTDFGVPEWAHDNPDLYRSLHEEGFDPPTVYEIYEGDQELYKELREAEVSIGGIRNIFDDPALYAEMVEQGVEQTDIYAFFSDREWFESVREANLFTEEIIRIIEHRELFSELMAAGFSPEVAADILQYPELVQIIETEGTSSQLMQAIEERPEVFKGLAEMNAPYEVVEDVLLGSDDVMERLTNNTDAPAGGDGEGTQSNSEAETSPFFTVEHGHGYTHELRDYADTQGIALSPSESWQLHLNLLNSFGQDYLQGIDKYQISGGYGNIGLSQTGEATWAPGVTEHIERFAESR